MSKGIRIEFDGEIPVSDFQVVKSDAWKMNEVPSRIFYEMGGEEDKFQK